MATTFGFLYMGCTLAPPGGYDSTVYVRRRCGLVSNYFDHLLEMVPMKPKMTAELLFYHLVTG